MIARAAYMPFLRTTLKIVIAAKPRAGLAPPLPRNDLFAPCGRKLHLIYYLLSFIFYLLSFIYYLQTKNAPNLAVGGKFML